jgi:hypothetical protein
MKEDDDIIHEAPEPSGQIYSIFIGMFTSPDYLQLEGSTTVADTDKRMDKTICNP